MSTLVPVLLAEMLLAMLAVVTGKGRREGEGGHEGKRKWKGGKGKTIKEKGRRNKGGRKKRARKVKWEGRCREGVRKEGEREQGRCFSSAIEPVQSQHCDPHGLSGQWCNFLSQQMTMHWVGPKGQLHPQHTLGAPLACSRVSWELLKFPVLGCTARQSTLLDPGLSRLMLSR